MNQEEERLLKEENKQLRTQLDFWKSAWFEQRVTTGKAWWEGYQMGIFYIGEQGSLSIVPHMKYGVCKETKTNVCRST